MLGLLSSLTLAVGVMGLPGDPAPAGKADGIRVGHCIVSLIEEAQVPAKESGLLNSVVVKEGQRVKKDDLLAQLDDLAVQIRKQAATLEFNVAQEQASNDVNVRFAQAAHLVSQAEYDDARVIYERNERAISFSEVRRRKLQADKAKLQIEQAEHENKVESLTAKVKAAAVSVAEEQIAARKVIAPFEGVVVRVQKHAGEWVAPGDVVLHLVRMDRLRVEGFVNAQDYAPQQVTGREVIVDVQVTRDRRERFAGKVDFASPIVEASGEYRIWADIENRTEEGHWLMRPGLRGDMMLR